MSKQPQLLQREAPLTLKDQQFYGLILDEEQQRFRDAIWNKENLIVFCNSKAGTGKTTIALGVANLLVNYQLYNKIYYIVSPTQEQIQGYLPGDQEAKSAPYMDPLLDAMGTLSIPESALISESNMQGMKNGTSYIEFLTHTYMRGRNFENAVVIIEEAQNFYGDSLKKVLTRLHDSCKTIVIGHSGQIDIIKHPERSGFVKYLEHYKDQDFAEICELNINHRGKVSTHADLLEF